jgi:hypothetical protein
MTGENQGDVVASLNVSKILVAILEMQKEVSIPSASFINAATEDRELQVDYNSDNQTFTFKLKDSNGQSDNDKLDSDIE